MNGRLWILFNYSVHLSLSAFLKKFLNKYHSLVWFALKALGAYFLWLFVLAFFPNFVYEVHFQLIRFQTWASANIISLLGFQGSYTTGDKNCLGHLSLNNIPSVCVGTGCSGLEMFVVYIVFLVVVNMGAWKRLLWFLPLGLVTIVLLNILRIVTLAFIYNYAPNYLDFNHKYTFVLVVYGAIFGLWYLWVSRIAVKTKNGEKE